MATIKFTESFDEDKDNLQKLYNEGLIGTYHVKAAPYKKSTITSEPAQSFQDLRQTDNPDKFGEPLDDHDEEENYPNEIEDEFDVPDIDDPDFGINHPAYKTQELDNQLSGLRNAKEGLDGSLFDIGVPKQIIAFDQGD